MCKLLADKKGQSMYLDLFLSFFIMVAALIFFFQSEANILNESDVRINELLVDANTIADSLMSQGLPSDWNQSTVIDIGIVENFNVNTTKILNLQDMTEADYENVRQLLRTRFDFLIFFENEEGLLPINLGSQIGKPGVNKTNIHDVENPFDLITQTRIVAYQNKPAKMVVYIWN